MSDYQVLSFGPLTAQVLDALARALYAPNPVASEPVISPSGGAR